MDEPCGEGSVCFPSGGELEPCACRCAGSKQTLFVFSLIMFGRQLCVCDEVELKVNSVTNEDQAVSNGASLEVIINEK